MAWSSFAERLRACIGAEAGADQSLVDIVGPSGVSFASFAFSQMPNRRPRSQWLRSRRSERTPAFAR
jgi:hypothetical protein